MYKRGGMEFGERVPTGAETGANRTKQLRDMAFDATRRPIVMADGSEITGDQLHQAMKDKSSATDEQTVEAISKIHSIPEKDRTLENISKALYDTDIDWEDVDWIHQQSAERRNWFNENANAAHEAGIGLAQQPVTGGVGNVANVVQPTANTNQTNNLSEAINTAQKPVNEGLAQGQRAAVEPDSVLAAGEQAAIRDAGVARTNETVTPFEPTHILHNEPVKHIAGSLYKEADGTEVDDEHQQAQPIIGKAKNEQTSSQSQNAAPEKTATPEAIDLDSITNAEAYDKRGQAVVARAKAGQKETHDVIPNPAGEGFILKRKEEIPNEKTKAVKAKDSFVSGFDKLQSARIKKHLDKPINTRKEGITTIGNLIESRVKNGAKVVTDNEIDYDSINKDSQKLSEHDAPAHPRRLPEKQASELRKKLSNPENYRKIERRLQDPDKTFLGQNVLGKFGMDYAEHLQKLEETNAKQTEGSISDQDGHLTNTRKPSNPLEHINGNLEKEQADRLTLAIQQVRNNNILDRNSREGNAIRNVETVADELRKKSTIVSYIGMLDKSSSDLMQKFGATAALIDDVVNKLSKANTQPTESATKPNNSESELSKPQPTANTIFTEDDAEKARQILKAKLGQLNSGIDPEIMQAGITLAGYHIEKGARTFAAYSKAMLDDLGDTVKPYLKSWYMGVKYDPRAAGFDGMDSAADVDLADINKLESGHAPSTHSNLESNSQNSDHKNQGNEKPVSDERTGNGRLPEQSVQKIEKSGNGRSRDSINTIDVAAAGGERGNKPVHSTEQPALSSELPPGVDDSERSDNPGNSGIQANPVADPKIKALFEQGNEKTTATRKVELRNKENIKLTLPVLNDGQVDDVHFAEERFDQNHGVLFTNGTGTGKTFSGLGIAKRFALKKKRNIIIVVPSLNIADQWAKSAQKFFDLQINQLEDTKSKGAGIVVTTYANFGANREIANRKWDLIVTDESHKLLQNEDGQATAALNKLRAISYHERGFYTWFDSVYSDVVNELHSAKDEYNASRGDDVRDQIRFAADARYEKAKKSYNAAKTKAETEYRELQQDKPKVVFLSATPFAYVKTIDYAEGYLFNYGTGETSGAYNAGNSYDQFYIQHFGYRMRYNRLTQPDANVDSGIMERQFNNTLKQSGALSFRMLDVPFDYDRKFVLTENAIGQRIDEAMEWIRENKYQALADLLNKKFDHLERRYLLEAIKATESIPIIKDHLAKGRKVLVFHDYKKGGSVNPFNFGTSEGSGELNAQIKAFNDEFGDLVKSFDSLPSPIDALTAKNRMI